MDCYARRKIEKLIQRMVSVEERPTRADESISRKAHKEAEAVSSPKYYAILKEYLSDHASPEEKPLRNAAYFILGKLLRNAPQNEYIAFYIECLTKETDKYLLSQMLDRIADLSIPTSLSIEPVMSLAKSETWLIRHGAIRALGASATRESVELLAYYINQSDTKANRLEIIYAIAALGKIGSEEDMGMLERHTASEIRDIRDSAAFAIQRIKERACRAAMRDANED